jgi:hypothetical protein
MTADDPLADFFARRREAHRQPIAEELLQRFLMAKGRGPVSVEEIRAFIATALAQEHRWDLEDTNQQLPLAWRRPLIQDRELSALSSTPGARHIDFVDALRPSNCTPAHCRHN